MIKYIFLGIVQGLTEFLPVSSSAHLIIIQKILGMSKEALALSVVLHLGTCFALLAFFFKDILNALRNFKTLLFILIVTVITDVIGISGKDFFEGLFSSTGYIAAALLTTGIILFFTKRFMEAKRTDINIKDSLILGLTQGIAIIPGISRSGITISTLLFRKIEREASFRLSFLVSIPAIFGAALLEARKIDFALKANFTNFLIGFISSLMTGFLALFILRAVMRKAKFYYFGYYCILVAVITFLFIR